MQKTKLKLSDLRVNSFITEIDSKKLHTLRAGGDDETQGGGSGPDDPGCKKADDDDGGASPAPIKKKSKLGDLLDWLWPF